MNFNKLLKSELQIPSIIAISLILAIFSAVQLRNQKARQIASKLTGLPMGIETRVLKYKTESETAEEYYCYHDNSWERTVTNIEIKITPSQAEKLLRQQNPYRLFISKNRNPTDNPDLEYELGIGGYDYSNKLVKLDSRTRTLSISIEEKLCAPGIFEF